jgi:NAD dependent epimerase/dehydratase family enzyme
VVLTRRVRPGPFRQVEWDGRTVGAWRDELGGSAVFNLAGELVDRRATAANVGLLTRSRVEPTRALVEASATLAEPVPVWVQASTRAIYGDAGDQVLDESSPSADGPSQMVGVAKAWEAAVSGARTECLITLRSGIALRERWPAARQLPQVQGSSGNSWSGSCRTVEGRASAGGHGREREDQ